jgi:TonB family protein
VKTAIRLYLVTIFLALPNSAHSSDWLKSQRPKFPKAALQNYSEGSVRLRIVLTQDGSVRDVIIVKSSGDPTLDEAAQSAVLGWKMKLHAIKPADLTRGRETIIDFKQEASVAARYPHGGAAAFTDEHGVIKATKTWQIWMFAPFPAYPFHARLLHQTGTVLLHFEVGNDGKVAIVQIVQSSGYKELDDAAVAAVRLWRAHKQFAGLRAKIPIRFTLERHH